MRSLSYFSVFISAVLIIFFRDQILPDVVKHCYAKCKEIFIPKKIQFPYILFQKTIDSVDSDNFMKEVKKDVLYNIKGSTKITNIVADIKKPDQKMLDKVISDITDLVHMKKNDENNNTDFCYGGLVSTPIAFFTGLLIPQQKIQNLILFDFDSTKDKWIRIKKSCFNNKLTNYIIKSNTKYVKLHTSTNYDEIVLIISCRYPINENEIKKAFPSVGINHLIIEKYSNKKCLSTNYQKEITNYFFKEISKLSASYKTIHLILATPNSLSFNLGRIFDARNLTNIVVYHYEKNNEKNCYPWGLEINAQEVISSKIIKNKFLIN